MQPRASDETGAANGALAHLGEPPLTSIEEPRAAAVAVRARFGDVRDALLAKHDWNFASTVTVPAAVAVPADADGWTRYALSDDVVKVRDLPGLDRTEWEVVGEDGATDPGASAAKFLRAPTAAAPRVRYTRRVGNVALWSELFLEVFQLQLGARLARQVARNGGLADALEERAERLLGKAQLADAQEANRRQVRRDPSWVRARR